MESLDIDKLMNMMSDPTTEGTIGSVLKALDQVNTVMGKFDTTVKMLDKMGLKPLIVRGLGQKLGVDPETPLQGERTGISGASEFHNTLFNQLNTMTEEDIQGLLTAGTAAMTEDNLEVEDGTNNKPAEPDSN